MLPLTVMDNIKTTALSFIAIVACAVLLLTPNSNRDNGSGDITPATLAAVPTIQPEAAFGIAREQPAAPNLENSLPEMPAKTLNQNSATTAEIQAIDWSQIMYPELAQIEELVNQPAYTALGELLPMLSSDDPVIRLAAIESLGDMTNRATLPALTAALNDPNPQLRIAALEALAAQEDESAVSSIEPYLYDQDREVRVAAIEALEELESETAVPALAGLLSDQDVRIRHHAVNALGEIGGEYAISYLLQARYDADETIRANAEDILIELES